MVGVRHALYSVGLAEMPGIDSSHNPAWRTHAGLDTEPSGSQIVGNEALAGLPAPSSTCPSFHRIVTGQSTHHQL